MSLKFTISDTVLLKYLKPPAPYNSQGIFMLMEKVWAEPSDMLKITLAVALKAPTSDLHIDTTVPALGSRSFVSKVAAQDLRAH